MSPEHDPAERLRAALAARIPGVILGGKTPLTSDAWPLIEARRGDRFVLIACVGSPIQTADRGLLEYMTLSGLHSLRSAVDECARTLTEAVR